jgi:hypothetical protein
MIPIDNMLGLREDIQKEKRLSFGHCPKVALTPPPPLLDTREVTFLSAHFGQLF